MKKGKTKPDRNFLEYIPERNKELPWHTDTKGSVTLDVENSGLFNRLAPKYFRKPRYTYVHLDKQGSYVWLLTDGKKDIIELGREVDMHFGEDAAPLYERLAKFFQILESYRFVRFIKKD